MIMNFFEGFGVLRVAVSGGGDWDGVISCG
jgi:hypothetical protein